MGLERSLNLIEEKTGRRSRDTSKLLKETISNRSVGGEKMISSGIAYR